MKLARPTVFLFCLLSPLAAQLHEDNLNPDNRTNGKITLQAVEQQRDILQKISAVILDGQTPVANGTIMSKDGYILTKADGLKEIKKLAVRIGSTLYQEVQIIGEDNATDLVLLKVNASNLELPVWGDTPEIGSIVVANGATTRTNRRARLGIISAQTRPIPPASSAGFLGLEFAPYQGNFVVDAYPGFAGEQAGVKPGDEFLAINGTKIEYPEDIMHLLSGKKADEEVELTVRRKDKELKLQAKLIEPPSNRNDMMSGRFNKRRDNFPESIQHDIPLSIYNSGGPLITLEGKTVGINIARANRAESFALVGKVVKEAFEKLKNAKTASKN